MLAKVVSSWRVVAGVGCALEVDETWSPAQLEAITNLADEVCRQLGGRVSIPADEVAAWPPILDEERIFLRGAKEVFTAPLVELGRAERMAKNELPRRLAARMATDEETAAAWIDGFIETLYESIKQGQSITLQGLGGFYVKPSRNSTWVFRFNPGQKLRALFRWSSTYKGEL
jgi:hypothetical protein